jgi:carbon monoxide dehydrogenase subunit G
MPGVDNVKQIDERTFDADIAASVGPIAGKFSFRATIVESQPPTQMRAEIDGSDSVTRSKILATMHTALEPRSAQETELAYRATVEIKGRLAIVGEMVLRTTARLIADEFARRLRTELAKRNQHP